jgi:hypothetical protein
MSHTRNLKRSLARTPAIDGYDLFACGCGLGAHDHPIPRWLHIRSNASRRTLGMVKGRSTRVFGPVASDSYLRNGSLRNAHSSDLSAIDIIPI